MKRVDKETKKLNKTWVAKQDELQKDWSGYYIGGLIVVVIVIGILVVATFKN